MKLRLVNIAEGDLPNRTNGSMSTYETGIIPKLTEEQLEQLPLHALDIEWLAEAALEMANVWVNSWVKTRPHSSTDEHKYTKTTPRCYPPTILTKSVKASQINSIRNAFITMRSHTSSWEEGWANVDSKYLGEVDWKEKTADDFFADHVTTKLLPELPSDWCAVSPGDRVVPEMFYNASNNTGLFAEAKKMRWPVYRFTGGMVYEPDSQSLFNDVITGNGTHLLPGFGGGFGGYKMSRNYAELPNGQVTTDFGRSGISLPTPHRTGMYPEEKDYAAGYRIVYGRGTSPDVYAVMRAFVLIDEKDYANNTTRHIEKTFRAFKDIVSYSYGSSLYYVGRYDSSSTMGLQWNESGNNRDSAICRGWLQEVAQKVGLDINTTADQVKPSTSFEYNWEIFLYCEDVVAIQEISSNVQWQ